MTQYTISAANARELVEGIETGIATGALAAGQRLPSVRQWARDTGLSPATVASAMAELRRRGVVLAEPRRGTSVSPAPPLSGARALMPVPSGARDLSDGNPDPALLPKLTRALRRAGSVTDLYGTAPALRELVDLAGEAFRVDGIAARSVCVVSGALDGIERVIGAHLRPGDAVAVENPGYAALFHLLRAQGLVLDPVAVDDRGLLPSELALAMARGVRAVVVTPRGQNPTGAAFDGERAHALREVLAGAPQVLVIEDDHLGAAERATLHTLVAGRAQWAATRSVAKGFGPDLRLSLLAADELTVARVQGRQQCGPGWVSHILQRVVLDLWRDPATAAALARARETYARRREHLLAALRRHGVAASGRSGFNVWVPVADEAATAGALLQRGWVVAPGGAYRLAGSAPAIRVTTAALRERDADRFAADFGQIATGAPARRVA
ncbi:MAG TPA: aminotransferase class I/II-fold pyridoxal phosphate-dependent enzyme [Solirubrobacteraceae bacterium]|nr:aminotransferase class I/II-fold pyridoxal phosphate-dependent enzyme [Solirubrobacteraceae bacterium]